MVRANTSVVRVVVTRRVKVRVRVRSGSGFKVRVRVAHLFSYP